ncbi:hypothetical protein TWF694_009857 [Orbilia ellipsospora]|uniref:Uncharacterized protein n=1 Tax=Orbilia ellipsospora TaxID=2528407 RepID=A0AAV9XDA4_9PEZI
MPPSPDFRLSTAFWLILFCPFIFAAPVNVPSKFVRILRKEMNPAKYDASKKKFERRDDSENQSEPLRLLALQNGKLNDGKDIISKLNLKDTRAKGDESRSHILDSIPTERGGSKNLKSRNLLGNQFELIGLASQISKTDFGLVGANSNHDADPKHLHIGTGGTVVSQTDAENNVLQDIQLAENPFLTSGKKLKIRNLIGNQVQAIGLASENSGQNNGDTGGAISHSTNSQNTAQQIVTDAQAVEVIKNAGVANNALVIVKKKLKRNLIGNQVEVIGLASQNSGQNNGNTGGAINHSQNSQNTAQQIVTDAQAIEIAKTLSALNNPLVIAKKKLKRRNSIRNKVDVVVASQNSGQSSDNTDSVSQDIVSKFIVNGQGIQAANNIEHAISPEVLFPKAFERRNPVENQA